MRIEATLPDTRRAQLRALESELHVSKSQVIDEALSLFVRAVMEVKRGRRLALVDAETGRAEVELASPSLSHLEWFAGSPRQVKLPNKAVAKIREMSAKPLRPSPALRKAMAQHRQVRKGRSSL